MTFHFWWLLHPWLKRDGVKNDSYGYLRVRDPGRAQQMAFHSLLYIQSIQSTELSCFLGGHVLIT